MSLSQRSLQGQVISLSISESEESARKGFPDWQVNRVTLQIASSLIGQGAGVVFGHDWREDGVMAAVYRYAQEMQPMSGDEEDSGPVLQNFLPWPDKPTLGADEIDRHSSALRIVRAGLPVDVRRFESRPPRSRLTPLFKYVRARALSHLRDRITDIADARICFGGRISGAQGIMPGLMEEAWFAVTAAKPLYLVGLLGGATAMVIEAIRGRDFPQVLATYVDFNAARPASVPPRRRGTDVRRAWEAFRTLGLSRLSAINGLTKAENVRLFETQVFDEARDLVLKGLGTVARRKM